jgi:adenylosuccinate synthase
VTGVRKWHKLPAAAQTYLERIASLAGIPLRLVSVGPEREQVVEKS